MDMKGKISVRCAGLFVCGNRILFVQHTKEDRSYFLLPGGNLQFGEKMTDALVREFSEELSVTAAVGNFLYLTESIDPRGERHLLQCVFRVDLDPAALRLGSDSRVTGFQFLSKEEFKDAILYPDQKKILTQFMQKPGSIHPHYRLDWS